MVGGAAVVGTSALAERSGSRSGEAGTAPAVVPDVVLAETGAGLATLHGTRHTVVPDALGTPDGSTLYATTAAGPATTALRAVRTATGEFTSGVQLTGRWVPRVVSPDGTLVALTAPAAGDAFRPAPHARTTIVVADRTGERHRVDLAGNYHPDAFTRDGSGLFLLDWLPPTAPDRYRVRMLNLLDGVPRPLLTRDKRPVPAGAEEEMRGDGRQAVLSPDRSTLFTLYTHQPEHQHTRDRLAGGRETAVHAFVHVLHLEQGWAYCLDLPEPFGHGPAAGHTIALTPDGGTLLVADTGSGRLLSADTETLTVRRTVPVPGGTGPASAVVDPTGRLLYLGAGTGVTVVDLARLAVRSGWDTARPVRGLALSPDGARLYVGDPDAVRWFRPATGAALGRAAVAGLLSLRPVG